MIGFNWLRIWSKGTFCERGNQLSGFTKLENFLTS